jgi:integrase
MIFHIWLRADYTESGKTANRFVQAASGGGISLTSAFREARKRAGITDLRLHDLRHDAAARFRKECKDVALVQKFLGDGDIKSDALRQHRRQGGVAADAEAKSASDLMPS